MKLDGAVCENGNMLVVQAYSLPAWLKAKIEDEARMNERTASAELRVRLSASFGLRTDGMPIEVGGDGCGLKAAAPIGGAGCGLKPAAPIGGANGGPGDEA